MLSQVCISMMHVLSRARYVDCIGEGCTTCSEWGDCGFGYVLEADALDVACDPGDILDSNAEGCFEKCCECECSRRLITPRGVARVVKSKPLAVDWLWPSADVVGSLRLRNVLPRCESHRKCTSTFLVRAPRPFVVLPRPRTKAGYVLDTLIFLLHHLYDGYMLVSPRWSAETNIGRKHNQPGVPVLSTNPHGRRG